MTTTWTKQIGLSVLIAPLLLGTAQAAETPPSFSDPTYIVVGYQPGGASDRAARFVAEQLQKKLDVSVIVENKTGAGGRVAAQYVKSQPESKDTLMIGNPAVMVVAPQVFSNLNYDPSTDFKAVSTVTNYHFGVAVAADSPIKTVQELLDWAKANPESFNIAVPASGSLPHFFALMLSEQAKVKAEVIGYRGSAPALTDLIGGTIPVAIDTLDVLTAQHKGGRVRILATSGAEPEAGLDAPTFKAAGLELEASGWNALFAPAVMSDVKVSYLGNLVKDIMSQSEVRERFIQSDLPPVAANHEETTANIEQFSQQWLPVIKASGYKVDQ